MTDENEYTGIPTTRIGRIKYSISNLWDEFGNVDSVGLGIVINLGLAALGLVVYGFADGLVAYAGVVWAIINVYPILQWVFRL